MSENESATDDSVWSKDIEDAFEEALAIYPPCGRRKIILSDEGKMYGRNELIARYIKMRTGKGRSRKQVSSHIQVLARKKQRELSLKLKHCDDTIRKTALENLATMSSAQIVSATMGLGGQGSGGESELSPAMSRMPKEDPYWDHPSQHPSHDYGASPYYGGPPRDLYQPPIYGGGAPMGMGMGGYGRPMGGGGYGGAGPYGIQRNSLVPAVSLPQAHRLCMVDFNAFLEYRWGDTDQFHKHSFVRLSGLELFNDPEMECVDIRQIYDKFPGLRELYAQGPKHCFYLVKFWADLSYTLPAGGEREYLMQSRFDSSEPMQIQCSSRVCSFGKQVVDKIQEPVAPSFDNSTGLYNYRFVRTHICEYMTSFIEKLKSLDSPEMMNSVLENFSVLQVVTELKTGQILFCVAYVFEISMDHGAQHHIYRLVEDH